MLRTRARMSELRAGKSRREFSRARCAWQRSSRLLLPETASEFSQGMGWKHRFGGGIIGFIGFLLSPLSWWNDAFINLPLALGFGWVVALFYKPAFETSVIIGYWLSNLLGFVLMHKGAATMLKDQHRSYSWKNLRNDVLISLLYTGLIIVLLKTKVLQPVENYFPTKVRNNQSTGGQSRVSKNFAIFVACTAINE